MTQAKWETPAHCSLPANPKASSCLPSWRGIQPFKSTSQGGRSRKTQSCTLERRNPQFAELSSHGFQPSPFSRTQLASYPGQGALCCKPGDILTHLQPCSSPYSLQLPQSPPPNSYQAENEGQCSPLPLDVLSSVISCAACF